MHTRHFDRTTIHYNPDLSGDVVIDVPGQPEARVPGWVLLLFVSERIAAERIAEIEGDALAAAGVPDALRRVVLASERG